MRKENQDRKLEVSALAAIKLTLKHLPYNRNKIFMEIWMQNSRCKLYIPLKESQVEKAKEIKDNLQSVFDLADF